MDLVERYLKEVGRELPARMRSDVVAELRSAIEDGIEARARGASDEAREEAAFEILREFGPPESIARSYLPPERYLIGPRHYPGFIRTTKTLLGITYALVVVGTIVYSLMMRLEPSELYASFIGSHQRFIKMGFWMFGVITAVYFAVERFGRPGRVAAGEGLAWDPSTLPILEEGDRVDRAGTVFTMCLYCLLFILFNFFQQYIGVFNRTNGDWWFMPVAGPGFADYLAFLNIWWVLAAVLGYFLLRSGRWRFWSKTARLALDILLAAILFHMAGDAGRVLDAGGHRPIGVSLLREAEAMGDVLVPLLRAGLRIGLYVSVMVIVWGIIRRGWRLAAGRPW